MPEMRFSVRWPDSAVSECYSPSLVMKDYLAVGQHYPVADFVERSRTALNIASERVRARYGFACSSALDQLARIEHKAAEFGKDPQGTVAVLGFYD